MLLKKYKVNKFRSVKGTTWIDVDNLACFVGLNESGKTNLLLPLWKFNPADDATEIDLLPDYPRDEYSEIDEDSEKLNEHFIEVLFELDDTEINSFEEIYASNDVEKNDEDEGENEAEKKASQKKEKYGFKKHLLIKKDYNGNFRIYLSNENADEESADIEEEVGEDVFQEICESIPRFVYYSEYGNLDSDLYLPRVKEDLERMDSLTGKERMKARTLKILFGHLGLNPDEILSLGQENSPNNNPVQKTDEQIAIESRNKQERYAKVKSAASRMTTQFRDWWTQGNYFFDFNADGLYFRILVSDTERLAPIELESRSRGLQWFFSFFLVFLAESEDNHKNCILLLDEPGLSLHPNAQNDLIKFFQKLSEKNQLIYTTHLPFLVDHNNLDKVKAVYTHKGLTKISNDISQADKEKRAIQPVNAAIGIKASESLLVGCEIVIVEGISDQFYLTMIKNYLISKDLFTPKSEMVFIPVSGAKGVKPVVSILQGTQNNLPYTLLDSDETGKQFQRSLQQGLYKPEKEKVLETDTFCGKEGSEIEDLIPKGILVDSFDRLFRSDDGLDVGAIDESKPVVPQLESFAKENRLGLDEDIEWKFKLSKRIKQKFTGEVPKTLESNWVKLFESLKKS